MQNQQINDRIVQFANEGYRAPEPGAADDDLAMPALCATTFTVALAATVTVVVVTTIEG